MNLTLLLTWQTPAMALFLTAALVRARRLTSFEQDLASGLVLTFAFFMLFRWNQGHGWGYRYTYAVLGNAALLAASAAGDAWETTRRALVRGLIAVSVGATLLVQLPLRMAAAEGFVRPYAATLAYLAALPADVVLVDPNAAYYGRDLVRNDPLFRDGPRIVSLGRLGPEGLRALLGGAGGRRVYLLTGPEMRRLGLTMFGEGPRWTRGAPQGR
jgi:hypothetical protein